ncbi:MAG: hypothetical protein ACE5JI_12575, partial [Acidobacteriota bacterium]
MPPIRQPTAKAGRRTPSNGPKRGGQGGEDDIGGSQKEEDRSVEAACHLLSLGRLGERRPAHGALCPERLTGDDQEQNHQAEKKDKVFARYHDCS